MTVCSVAEPLTGELAAGHSPVALGTRWSVRAVVRYFTATDLVLLRNDFVHG